MFVSMYNESQIIKNINNPFIYLYKNIKFNNYLNKCEREFIKDDYLRKDVLYDFIQFIKNNEFNNNKYPLDITGTYLKIGIKDNNRIHFRKYIGSDEVLSIKYTIYKLNVDLAVFDKVNYHSIHTTTQSYISRDDITDIIYITKKYMIDILKKEIYGGK